MSGRPANGLEIAVTAVGGRWKLLLLRELGSDRLRYGDLKRRIRGIGEKPLIRALQELHQDGLVARHDFKQIPPKVEYELTDLGRSLTDPIAVLEAWGAAHAQDLKATASRKRRRKS